MPTMGALRCMDPVEPKKPFWPNEKIPPSAPTIQ